MVMLAQQTATRRKFGGYKGEKPKIVREVKVEENQAVRQIVQAFQNYHPNYPLGAKDEALYEEVAELVRDIDYSATDVTKFSIMLKEFEEKEYFTTIAGYFLSALINSGNETDYRIEAGNLPEIDYLGTFNTKNITVIGNVGDNLGQGMRGGSIVVFGDTYGDLGHSLEQGEIVVKGHVAGNIGPGMKGGRITIEGNAGDMIGGAMEGGEIIILGGAGDDVGCYHCIKEIARVWDFERISPETHLIQPMKGGKIVVEGNIGRRPGLFAEGGQIIHKGKIIFDK